MEKNVLVTYKKPYVYLAPVNYNFFPYTSKPPILKLPRGFPSLYLEPKWADYGVPIDFDCQREVWSELSDLAPPKQLILGPTC